MPLFLLSQTAYSSLALDLCPAAMLHSSKITLEMRPRRAEDGIAGTSLNALEHGRGRPVQQGASPLSTTTSTADATSEGKTSRYN